MKEYFFVSSDGALCDTRKPDWASRPLRPIYCRQYREIDTSQELRATLRAGGYAWPGGYPLAIFTTNGGTLCFPCARENIYQMLYSIRYDIHDGWKPAGCDVVYSDEENPCFCDHCGEEIQ